MRNPTLPSELDLQVELPTIMPRSKTRPSVRLTAAQRAIEKDPEIPYLTEQELIERIQQLRTERNAVILAHNYQLPIIQDLADFVGDSLQLSQQAAQTDAPVIVFCGVHFMAETAAILCPDRTVLIPDPEAGCSLAATVTAEEVRQWKANHPNGVVVAYVNTNADVKAEADYCCTSSNAVKVVQSIPEDKEILFLPDMFLGLYVQRMTGRKVHLWLGECHVHAGFRAEDIARALQEYPDADLLLHPECGCVSQCMFALAVRRPTRRAHLRPQHGRHGAPCARIECAHPSRGDRSGHATPPEKRGAPQAIHPRQGGRHLRIHEDHHAAQTLPCAARHGVRSARGGADSQPRPPSD
jgi:quinolinate synthase